MNLATQFLRTARSKNINEPAMVFVNKNGSKVLYSWHHLKLAAIMMAMDLKKMGIEKDDFVAIIALNLPESFIAMWSIILIGAVPVPIHAQLVKQTNLEDINKIINDCRPKLILANACLSKYLKYMKHLEVEKIIQNALEHVGASSTCGFAIELEIEELGDKIGRLLIMPYTSGTSGKPKGVRLSHRNIYNRVMAISKELAITHDERILSYMPLGHISELIATFFGQAVIGYTVYFTEHIIDTLENREHFKKTFVKTLRIVKPTAFLSVPRIWKNFKKELENKFEQKPILKIIPAWFKKIMIKKGLGLEKTRIFMSAASTLPKEDWQFFNNLLGIDILDIYGQTETAGPLTINGKPIGDNSTITISPTNEEILVSGDCVMAGYHMNPEANRKVFSGNPWNRIYKTGDTGRPSSRDLNKIYFQGRIDDDFKLSNGEKINTALREALEEKIKKNRSSHK